MTPIFDCLVCISLPDIPVCRGFPELNGLTDITKALKDFGAFFSRNRIIGRDTYRLLVYGQGLVCSISF
jgi:hypothetical protein